jgi:hypothetical protein
MDSRAPDEDLRIYRDHVNSMSFQPGFDLFRCALIPVIQSP